MDLTVIAPWLLNPSSPYTQLSLDYANRFRKPFQLNLKMPHKSLKTFQESSFFIKKSIDKWSENKGQLVVCDPSGLSMKSENFSSWIQKQQTAGIKSLGFIIGGADGVPSSVYGSGNNAFNEKPLVLSFSQMTFAHELALVILLEQLFRCQCIINHHPYHKGKPSSFSKTFNIT